MKKKLLVLFLATILLTGCTTYLKDEDKKIVRDEETGQNMVENILCKTELTEKQHQIKIDEKLKVLETKFNEKQITQEEYDNSKQNVLDNFDTKDIVYCNEFKITSNSDGLWTTVLVKPLSLILIKLGALLKNSGLAIIIVTLGIRLLLYPVTKKTAVQSENMKNAKPKLDKLEEKYRNRTDRDSQMMKSQEMMKIYKDYNISPLSGCLFAIIQIPLFFAFYEALYRVPVIFEGNLFGLKLGLTPFTALKAGQYYYLLIIVLVILTTYYSFKLNQTASMGSGQEKQMAMMMKISVVMIGFASFTVSTAIAIYWIFNSGFTIIQNILVKRSKKNADII